jgi:hypothetical protein
LGDSAGGLFIQDGSTWKLAGINYAVDGPYNLTNSGAGFDAAIFDAGGLYTGTEGNWSFMPERATNQPGAFYATRVSAHVAWIQSVLAQPLNPRPILQSAAAPQGPYSDETAAVVDATAETITISIPPTTRFYRLSSTASLTIQSVNLAGSQLIFRYR